MTIIDVVMGDISFDTELSDGRVFRTYYEFYPRLLIADYEGRNNWRIIGDGEGIHWPLIDEDISLENILTKSGSHESRRSFDKYLKEKV